MENEKVKLRGIYYLMKGENIVYIGSSFNIESRVKHHYDKDFDTVEFVKSDLDRNSLFKMEKELIRKHKPKYNKNLYPTGSFITLYTEVQTVGELDKIALNDKTSRTDIINRALNMYIKKRGVK